MFISSLPIKPLPSLYPFSRNTSNDENYHIKKRNNPLISSEVPVFIPAKNEASLKKSNLILKNDSFQSKLLEKRDLHGILDHEFEKLPSKKIHTSTPFKNSEEIIQSDASDNSNSSKKSSKYFQKFLSKIKLQKTEFISLESCVNNNKLSFLPYIRSQDTRFNNRIIPVLPKALFDQDR